MDYDYNTQRPPLILKEYGRNVQKLAAYINTLEDKEKRNRFAHLLTDLMRQIHPNMRDGQDYSNKLWDDLYILSGFDLDVEGPFPLPEKTLLGKKPRQVPYNTHQLKFMHYGRNVELMIEKASQLEDTKEREIAIIYLGRLMKTFYTTWNKDTVDDAVIVNQIREISGGKLQISVEKVKSLGLFDGGGIREREKPVLEEEKNKNFKKKNFKNNNNNNKNGNNNLNNQKKRRK
jgi:hypothetical protein